MGISNNNKYKNNNTTETTTTRNRPPMVIDANPVGYQFILKAMIWEGE